MPSLSVYLFQYEEISQSSRDEVWDNWGGIWARDFLFGRNSWHCSPSEEDSSMGRGQTCEHQQSRQTPVLSKHNVRAQSITNHDRLLGVKIHSTGPLNISSELVIECTHLAFIQSSIVVDGFPVHMGSLTANRKGALTAPPPGKRPPGTGYVLSSFVTMKWHPGILVKYWNAFDSLV